MLGGYVTLVNDGCYKNMSTTHCAIVYLPTFVHMQILALGIRVTVYVPPCTCAHASCYIIVYIYIIIFIYLYVYLYIYIYMFIYLTIFIFTLYYIFHDIILYCMYIYMERDTSAGSHRQHDYIRRESKTCILQRLATVLHISLQ